jgi:hypothetical protein
VDLELLNVPIEAVKRRDEGLLGRLDCLTTHRSMHQENGIAWLVTDGIAAAIYEGFPWGEVSQLAELRDVRTMLSDELGRATYLPSGSDAEWPQEVALCVSIGAKAKGAWRQLVGAAVAWAREVGADLLVFATWEGCTEETILHITTRDGAEGHYPLVWNLETWRQALSALDWWPDLARASQALYSVDDGMRAYPNVRAVPLELAWSDAFIASVPSELRGAVVKAVTKRAYGILDAGLGDEPFGQLRRMRVTDFWRIHYLLDGDTIRLAEFGPHSIGGVD